MARAAAGLSASLVFIAASGASALEDSHEAGIIYAGTWSTVAHAGAIGGSYAGASAAMEDATVVSGSFTPNPALTFFPPAATWTIVETSAASGGSYMVAPNDGAPALLIEENGTAANGLSYADGRDTWYQGSVAKSNVGVAKTIDNTEAVVLNKYTDTSNNVYDCTGAELSDGTDTCNNFFKIVGDGTYTYKNVPNDFNSSIEFPFTGSNVSVVFSSGTQRGKVDVEVRKVSDGSLVKSLTAFDTSTASTAQFWGMAHDAYKVIIKGTGVAGAVVPQGTSYYFRYALVYPSVEYRFFGPSILYEGVKQPDYGMVNIYIDGVQEDGDLNMAGTQPFDLYNPASVWTTVFSNTRDGVFTNHLGYSNNGSKHTLLIEVNGQKNPSSTGYRLAVDKFRALPSISGTVAVPADGALNIATTAHSNQGVWKLLVDGGASFVVENNSPGDKELNMYFGGGFTHRNFHILGLSAGLKEFSFVSKWFGRDPQSTANKVTFDGLCNAAARYTFTGPAVSYLARRGPNQGRVKVILDGVEQDADPQSPAVQPFDLYSATEQLGQVIFSTSSLTNAQHTIWIEQEGTKHAASTSTAINVDAFQTTLETTGATDIPTTGGFHILPFTMGGNQYIAASNHVEYSYTPQDGWNTRYGAPDTKVYKLDPATGATLVATLPTTGATGLEHFTIGGDNYLAVASYRSDPDPLNMVPLPPYVFAKSVGIYKWDPSQNNGTGGFDSDAVKAGVNPLQSIGAKGPQDIEFFEEGGERYLAIGSSFDGGTYNLYTKIYRWDSASGSFGPEIQSLYSERPSRIIHFRINGALYLGIANSAKMTIAQNDTTISTASKIYKWGAAVNGGNPGFAAHQSINTMGASDMEFFTIDGLSYLAIASSDEMAANSRIYRWDAGTEKFDVNNNVQSFPGNSVVDFEYFYYGGSHYLAQSKAYIYASRPTDIYKWNGTSFVMELAQLPNITQGRRIEHFFMGNKLYLAVGEFKAGNSMTAYARSSKLFLFQ